MRFPICFSKPHSRDSFNAKTMTIDFLIFKLFKVATATIYILFDPCAHTHTHTYKLSNNNVSVFVCGF